ncbi:aminoglycoside phosphotransferase family protein [Streptomyces sp. 4503]|uniref:Aminoglycoside phosphotransferase family protein n=1 Tax=Streptomyces niphimycinicus TaxID=2842201 RepID=A0ABS6CIK2_9ACTN|nr:aminoglycoside phosphotransferase family protein [Streptomyces niphimycinicus]MBU3866751.1 aminoglycoside phosphotransferase family protein [Streptomyces niphimycinicus]
MTRDSDERLTAADLGMPEATGSRRMDWAALPREVTARIEQRLGSPVAQASSQPGGFSAGLAARVRLRNGERAFIKAANSLTAPAEADFHRREIAVSERLPREVPAPRLLDAYDDGTWVVLAFQEIPGHLPAQPWQREELHRALAAVTEMANVLTPSPVDQAILAKPRLGGWSAMAGDAAVRGKVEELSPWAAHHVDQLAALEENAALDGATLLHGDLYPFNIMLTADRVFVVDWPHAWIGPRHCDAVTLMSSASLSGVDPRPIAENHPLTRDLDPARINEVLALHAGFLLRTAVAAGPDADPHIVAMMTALGLASLRWLRTRL